MQSIKSTIKIFAVYSLIASCGAFEFPLLFFCTLLLRARLDCFPFLQKPVGFPYHNKDLLSLFYGSAKGVVLWPIIMWSVT